MGTYKTSTCRDRRKRARGMDKEEELGIKIAWTKMLFRDHLYLSEEGKPTYWQS